MAENLISIVIIEYYSVNELVTCIKSIRTALTGLPFEIIISSNSCYDNKSRELLKNKFPGTKICFNDRNGGFAYGMNRGLEIANGEYLAIVNPDVIVLEGFGMMIDFLKDNPGIGAAGPQMMDNSGVIQDTCRNYVSLQSLLFRQVRRFLSKSPIREYRVDHNAVQTADWLTGAFIIVTRDAYLATKGLDEAYFMYAEDLDWCTRIRKAGFEIVYYPDMKVRFAGTRIARRLNNYTWIFIKSHIRYWSKYGFISGFPKRSERVFN